MSLISGGDNIPNMIAVSLRVFVLVGLLFVGGCERKPDVKTKPSSPSSPAVSDAPGKKATDPQIIESRKVLKRYLDASRDSANWPVIVYHDQNFEAVPKVPLKKAGLRDLIPLLWVVQISSPGYVPYHYTVIDGMPVAQAPPGATGAVGVGQGVAESTFDRATGDTTITTPQGETIVQHSDGSFDVRTINGFESHISPPGAETGGTNPAPGNENTPSTPGNENTSGNKNTGGNKGTPQLPPSSGPPTAGIGEPHYLTQDGASFSTQKCGEYILASRHDGSAIQVRQEPWKTSERASAITALAFKVGSHKLEVRLDGAALIDGNPAPDGEMIQGNLDNGGAIGIWRKNGKLTGSVIIWPDLSVCHITVMNGYLDFSAQWASRDAEQIGFLGNRDENPANDFRTRGGDVINPEDPEQLAKFVNSWQLLESESLFTYLPRQKTESFTIVGFPTDESPPNITTEILESVAPLPDGPLRHFAAIDLALTGDHAFLASYNAFAERLQAHALRTKAPVVRSQRDGLNADVGRPRLTEEQRQKAKVIDPNFELDEKLADGDVRVYRFVLDERAAESFGVLSEELDLKPYRAGGPGYQFHDRDGQPLGQPEGPGRDLLIKKFKPKTTGIP